jgi:hypothetical protein
MAQRVGESLLIDQRAATCVEKKSGGLHEGEGIVIDHVFIVGGERAVEGDDIGGAEEIPGRQAGEEGTLLVA